MAVASWLTAAIEAPGDDCIEWPFSRTADGYGQLRYEGEHRMATHVALELSGQPRPTMPGRRGACALHRCDNPPCVNPRHLWWGTISDNVADMVAKGRGDGRKKLTADEVGFIRTRLAAGVPVRLLAAAYEVTPQAIYNIRNGVSWSVAS